MKQWTFSMYTVDFFHGTMDIFHRTVDFVHGHNELSGHFLDFPWTFYRREISSLEVCPSGVLNWFRSY